MKSKQLENEYYVNPDEMWEELDYYYQNIKSNPNHVMTHNLGVMIDDIATKLGFLPRFINYCVDEKTQALTKRGWLNYKEITLNDDILSYDSGELKWSKILDIFINENYVGPMHKLTNLGLDALVTPNHKFIIKQNGVESLLPVEKIRVKDRMVLMGSPETSNYTLKYSDDFVKLVGWVVTEGNFVYGKNHHAINVFQKSGEQCDEIETILNVVGAKYKKYLWNYQSDIVGFRITGKISDDLIKVCDGKLLSYSFINDITYHQRLELVNTMIKGDGWIRSQYKYKDGETPWSYAQLDADHIDRFVMLCTLCGLTTSTKLVDNLSSFSDNPYYVVNIFKNPKLECPCESINFYGGLPGPGGDLTNGKIDNIPMELYSGAVWCPTTEYGSFIARRGKYVYVTGNSYKSEMIGDAVHKMVKAVNDLNFTLWKDYRCTSVLNDGGKDFVIVWNSDKKEWDDKRTYLKSWDVVSFGEEDLSIPDFEGTYPFVNFIKYAKSEKTDVWLKCTKVFKNNTRSYVRAWDEKSESWYPELFPVTSETSILPRSVPNYEDDIIGMHPCTHTITIRNNPFSYFTRVAYHAFVNRIKKEKKVDEVLHKYQEKVYEDLYSSGGGWENVKRQKIEDDDYVDSNGVDIHIDTFYKEENELS